MCPLTDDPLDWVQRLHQAAKHLQPGLVAQHAFLDDRQEVLQLTHDHEAEETIQPGEPIGPNALLWLWWGSGGEAKHIKM